VPATGKPKLLAGDADPLEVLRGGDHLPHQRSVLVLHLLALHQGAPCLGGAVGELVADRLQLTEVEHPRGGGNRFETVGHPGVTEGLAEERTELRLQARDLAAQLEPRLALVASDPEPGELLAFQQSRHPGNCRSGGPQGRGGHPESLLDGDLRHPLDLHRGDREATGTALDSVALGGGTEEEADRPLLVGDRQRPR
jgi:hypothetical protein